MKKYYDPEYDRTVDERVVRQQYEWFAKRTWFHETFEQFAEENFTEIKEDKDMTMTTNATNFTLDGVTYSTNDKGNYFYKTTGKFDKKGQEMTMRIGRPVFEKAFEEYVKRANDDAEQDEWDSKKEEAENLKKAADVETENEFNKKKTKKAAKPRKSKDIAHSFYDENTNTVITLTAKQVKFIKRMPEDDFYEKGLDSTLWTDCYSDTVSNEFNPMAFGAMVSTLREKGVINVNIDDTRKGKPKYMEFTELGKQVAKELGLN